jgi:anti-anti-sigma factor
LSEHPEPFAIRVFNADERAVEIRVAGELDMSTAPQLEETLSRELGAGRSVLLDLSAVTFMDSSGLNTIVTASRSAVPGKVVFTIGPTLSSQVQRVLEITGLRDLLPIATE